MKALLPTLALAAALATPALAQLNSVTGVVTGNNVISNLGSSSVSLGGTTFTNQGLVGAGRMSSGLLDAWGQSFGSVSGLQINNNTWTRNSDGSYSGSFFTLPDRGYNSGTTFSNYASRVQQVDFNFNPYYGSAAVGQTQLSLTYNAAASTLLTANTGAGLTTTTGLVPNATATLAGATVPFVTTDGVNKVAIDAEALVVKANGSGWVSDEYGANIYHFNSAKQIDGVITPPAAVQPHSPAGTLNFDSEITPVNGRRGNQGMEGLALSPDGKQLFALMQSATIQDSGSGNQGRRQTRLFVYDVSNGDTPTTPAKEYVLTLPVLNDTGAGSPNKTAAQSEIVVLDATHILVLSRDGNGANGTLTSVSPVFKSVLLVDLSLATNIVGLYDAEGGDITSSGTTLQPGITAVTWAEALNMLNSAQLAKFGLNLNSGAAVNANTLSEKWEGMTLVSALDDTRPNDYFLFLANDNDFLGVNTVMPLNDGSLTTYHPLANGAPANDTLFLAYRVTIEGIGTVPEPSTYTAIGALALFGLVALRRRSAR